MWPESGKNPPKLCKGLTTGCCATACCVAAAELLLAQREGLERELERLLRHWQPMMQVTVQRVTLRWMKTKWGSCTPAKGTIRINLALAERSPAALEMVLVHEMVHLLEPSHNARFYALMDRFLPEWRVAQRELEGEVK